MISATSAKIGVNKKSTLAYALFSHVAPRGIVALARRHNAARSLAQTWRRALRQLGLGGARLLVAASASTRISLPSSSIPPPVRRRK